MAEIWPKPVEKSPLDNRQYRALVLSNKLKVICISDETTDKSAASISVGAGSMNDPENLQGLAHFCEHMLFLGTEKYPVENDYSKYLAENAGGSNAYTARDHTNFFFDVSPVAFEGALDRFSQFFIAPLFTPSATEREINAVNSEHEKNISSDNWRSYQLELSTSNLKHPYSRFPTGNKKTLWENPQKNNIDVCAALKEYYQKYYSSNIQCLAVLGKQSLDEIQEMVEKMFSPIKNFNVELPRWEENPYGKSELTKRIQKVPIMDVRQLYVMFPIPDTTHLYKSSPQRYVSHLLGHEGEGSLLSLLKYQKNWVTVLETSASSPARGFANFKLAVDLTPEGVNHIDEIVEHVFQYLKMLQETGPQKWVFEELKDVNAMHFRFKDKEKPQSFVSRLTEHMHDYPLEDVLSAGYILTDFNENLINEILSCLTPRNCRITVTTKAVESKCKNTEEWYGIKYNIDEIDLELIEKWENCGTTPELRLPDRNEFIPTNFELKPRDENSTVVPKIILESPLSRAWYLQDSEFKLPKAIVRLEIRSPLPLLDPLNANLHSLMIAATKDMLTEYSYFAKVAGLHYSITITANGYEVSFMGYDQKLGLLMESVLKKLTNFSCQEERFNVLFEKQFRGLKNWKDQQPHNHASYYMTTLLREKRWVNQDLLEAMNDVSLEKLEEYAKEFVSKKGLKLEWFLYGNLTNEEALELVTKCQSLYESKGVKPLLPAQVAKLREAKIPKRSNYVFKSENVSHVSSCCAVYLQTGLQNTKENVLIEVLEQIARESCFHQLRTQEQLGYIVHSSVRRSNGTQGLYILVQSTKHPVFVESRIDNFISDLSELLHCMSEEKFVQFRNAVRTKKSEKPKKLIERGNIVWSEISCRQYNFERQDVELKALEELTLKELQAYFDLKFGPQGVKQRKISIHIVSTKKDIANGNEVDSEISEAQYPPEKNIIQLENIAEWRQHLALYSTAVPFVPIQTFFSKSL